MKRAVRGSELDTSLISDPSPAIPLQQAFRHGGDDQEGDEDRQRAGRCFERVQNPEDDGAEAVDVVEAIAARIEHRKTRHRMKEIGQHVDDFEFDRALELLNVLRDTLNLQTPDSANLS